MVWGTADVDPVTTLESSNLLTPEQNPSEDTIEDGLTAYFTIREPNEYGFEGARNRRRSPWSVSLSDAKRRLVTGTRHWRVILIMPILFGCMWFAIWKFRSSVVASLSLAEVQELINQLPQHDPNLKWPEGRNGRYLHFSGRSWGAGWNNIVREQLLTAYLASLSRRAFVDAPYIASQHQPIAGVADLHVPTAAFTWSPLSGAPFPGSRSYGPKDPPDEDVTPRTVSEDFYNSVCPRHRRVRLDVREVCKELGLDVDEDDVKVITEAWAKKLLEMDDPCIDIINHPLFDYMVFADRVISLWHGLSKSPLFTQWDWSPLIHTEVAHAGFPVPSDTPSARLRLALPSTHPWASSKSLAVETSSPTTPFTIPGLIAAHVRRNDYEEHCKFLSWAKVEYGYWASFGTYGVSTPTFPPGVPHHNIRPDHVDPTLPKLNDTLYDPPFARHFPRNPDGSVDPTTLTLEQLIQYHCYPDLDAVRDRMHAVREWQRAKGRELKDVFIMTNGSGDWIVALRALLKEDGWGEVKTSRDLTLSQSGQIVNQGIDMAIANWAEVFLGNGFSSLTSNVVGFRLAQGYPVDSIHFF